jgi:hypothetical protein
MRRRQANRVVSASDVSQSDLDYGSFARSPDARGGAAPIGEREAFRERRVLRSIYRPLRAQPAEAMRVTFRLDLVLFRARAILHTLASGPADWAWRNARRGMFS